MKQKRSICLVLTLFMLISLVACGKGNGGSGEAAPAQQSAPISPEGQWIGKGGCYKLDMLSEGGYSVMKGSPEQTVLCSDMRDKLYSRDGSLLYSGCVYDYTVVEDGFWCVRAVGMVDGNYIEDCYAVKLDFAGQELNRFDVPGRPDSIAAVGGSVYVYDAMNKTLRAYSADGEELGSFIPDGDGFLCLSVTGLSRLRPAQPREIQSRTRLTLGTLSPYEGEDLAARFNAMSSDYYVETIDYSNGSMDPTAALMKLNTELMSGHGPDLILASGLNFSQSSSAFADMYPLLDADPELTRDDFYALTAMENGGKLLLAPSSLYLSTFGALPEVVGDRKGWTWDEYFEVESKLPADGVMYS